MYYLTMNDDGADLTKLLAQKPVYFTEEREWSRPGGAITSSSSMFWPGLKEKAWALGLRPGPEGIAEVTINIQRVTEQ